MGVNVWNKGMAWDEFPVSWPIACIQAPVKANYSEKTRSFWPRELERGMGVKTDAGKSGRKRREPERESPNFYM